MNENSLFQEIDEDLQRKKMEMLWKRYGHYVLAGALAIVLATAAFNGWKTYKTRAEQKATGAVVGILNDKNLDVAAQIEKLEHFATTNPGISQAFLARFEAASAALKDGKNDKALDIYNAMSADATVEAPFRQLADLFSIQLQVDSGDPAALQTRLQALINESPWKPTAKEISAFLSLKTGDKENAKKLFTELTTDAGVPVSIAQRAADMQRWLSEGEKAEAK